MSRGPERDALVGDRGVGSALVVGRDQGFDVDEAGRIGELAGLLSPDSTTREASAEKGTNSLHLGVRTSANRGETASGSGTGSRRGAQRLVAVTVAIAAMWSVAADAAFALQPAPGRRDHRREHARDHHRPRRPPPGRPPGALQASGAADHPARRRGAAALAAPRRRVLLLAPQPDHVPALARLRRRLRLARGLRDIAETIRRRFLQQSVLTFDYPERPWDPVNAVEVEVPGVDVGQVRDGFLADADARRRIMGASVTLDGRLILIAALADLGIVERFVTEDRRRLRRRQDRPGRREFVNLQAGPRARTSRTTGFPRTCRPR